MSDTTHSSGQPSTAHSPAEDTSSGTPPSRAVVLGGGGIAGIAWEGGLLVGLMSAGINLDAADLVVGTSAGSAVAVTLRAGGLDPENAASLLSPSGGSEESGVGAAEERGSVGASDEAANFDGMNFVAFREQAAAGGGGEQEVRARLGELARTTSVSMSAEAWVGSMRGRLPSEWPQGRLGITAVDALDGSFHVFDAASGVDVVEAVAASCTVPTVYPLVEIDGRPFMDGGMRSATNADVAAGHDRVLVIACGMEEESSPFGPTLPQAMTTLEHEGEAMLIVADASSLEAFGTNVLDPATSAPAFMAGLEQAQAVAEQVREFWNA